MRDATDLSVLLHARGRIIDILRPIEAGLGLSAESVADGWLRDAVRRQEAPVVRRLWIVR
jgi:hypothetical protein